MNDTYLIYGSDYSLIKREIDKIVGLNKDIVRYDLSVSKVDEMLDDASCISLFGDKKVLIGENALFLTSSPNNVNHDLEYFEKYISDGNHENIVILTVLSEKLDERKKIVKTLKKKVNVIKKDEINEKDLPAFVIDEFKSLGYKIDRKTANYFVMYVGKNVDIIISEINKMVLYKEDDKVITVDDVNAISSKAYNDNVFDLCDGIMKKDFKKVYNCYNDLINLKEEPIKIISLIANQFILVYQCKVLSNYGKTSAEISEGLKVHPYRVKLALETNYMLDEVEKIIKDLHELDFKIKSGKIDKNVGLERFILSI